jgi:ketopantoate hydroxymethyltransferase
MRRRHVSLSNVIDRTIESQVKLGRYKDFSAAIQDAAWNYFVGPDSPFDEYGVTPEEVERAHAKVLAAIKRERRKGILKPWRP